VEKYRNPRATEGESIYNQSKVRTCGKSLYVLCLSC